MESVETDAYHALVADGGRPSHPIHLLKDVLAAPGEYRAILECWQTRPDEWQVMTKQLARWKLFREFQAAKRVNFFAYAQQVEVQLGRRLGFKFPPSFQTFRGGLKEEPNHQGKLATWIEYLYYEYDRLSRYEGSMRECEPRYLEAWTKLAKSQSLSHDGTLQSPLDLCHPSSPEYASREWMKRALRKHQDLGPGAMAYRRSVRACGSAPSSRHRQQTSTEIQEYFHLNATLKQMEDRARIISDCGRGTEPYRVAYRKVELQRALLRWASDQIPLILKEEDDLHRALAVSDCPQEGVCSFPQFFRLPPELRCSIWTHNLPPRPTAHFFDVLNHPRLRHLAQYWNTKEFRVVASKDHDSGYLAVYTLLAVCRESRLVVGGYYRRLQTDHGDVTTPAWHDPFPVFQTFDWIPADDLVVLCFPPKERPLPERNAINLGRGPSRHVGVLFPKETLMIALLKSQRAWNGGPRVDDDTQVGLVPAFLEGLCQPGDMERGLNPAAAGDGGIAKLYILYEAWHSRGYHRLHLRWRGPGFTPAERSEWLEASRQPGVSWHLRWEGSRVFHSPWRFFTAHISERGQDDVDFTPPREPAWWWVGSGTNAVRGHDPDENVSEDAAEQIVRVAEKIRRGCRWWRGFGGVEVLGWVVDELQESRKGN